MILGTAQLGLNYGIHNSTGQPLEEVAMEILDYAYRKEILWLDTASAYGTAEGLIGKYQRNTGNQFHICSKMPVELGSKSVLEVVQDSRNRLNCETIDIYYLHRFEQCQNNEIMVLLDKARQGHMIDKLGVSIYSPDELKYIMKNLLGVIDVVQIPYNLANKDLWYDDLIAEASQYFDIYARSIYLQGLFFMQRDDEQIQKLHGEQFIDELAEMEQQFHQSIDKIAMDFVTMNSNIKDCIVGCETMEQLMKNISLNKEGRTLELEEYRQLRNKQFAINDVLIDPRRW